MRLFLVHYVLMSYLNDLHKASSLNRGFNSICPIAAEHDGNEEINKTLESEPHRSGIQRKALLCIFVCGHFIYKSLA